MNKYLEFPPNAQPDRLLCLLYMAAIPRIRRSAGTFAGKAETNSNVCSSLYTRHAEIHKFLTESEFFFVAEKSGYTEENPTPGESLANALKLYLIDEDGRPLSNHIVSAIASLEGKLMRQFGAVCDPAVLSNKIEAAGKNTARYERKNGPLHDVKSFLWKSVTNLVISDLRGKPKEQAVDSATLERWAGPAREAGPEQIHNYVLARETLEAMPERDQQICRLFSQGVSAREIGASFGMSEQNVWTTLSRVRKTTQKALSDNGVRSSE